MTRLPRDFSELLELFNIHGVEYLLIGGYAVAIHGYPRPTADIDLWVNGTLRNGTGSWLRC